MHDTEVKSHVQPHNINDNIIELDRTVVIDFVPRTCAECDVINEECLERLDGNPVSYEAIAKILITMVTH